MSERRHAGNPEQESLQKAPLRTPQWSASFFERSNLLALLLDSRGTVVRANSAVKQLLADHGRQLAGTPLESYLLGPEHG